MEPVTPQPKKVELSKEDSKSLVAAVKRNGARLAVTAAVATGAGINVANAITERAQDEGPNVYQPSPDSKPALSAEEQRAAEVQEIVEDMPTATVETPVEAGQGANDLLVQANGPEVLHEEADVVEAMAEKVEAQGTAQDPQTGEPVLNVGQTNVEVPMIRREDGKIAEGTHVG